MGSDMTNVPSPKDRDNVDQDQFLTVLSREDALARFDAALFPLMVPSEQNRTVRIVAHGWPSANSSRRWARCWTSGSVDRRSWSSSSWR